MQSAFNRYEPLKDIEIEYNRGWAEDEAFEDILVRSEATDRLQGYTSSGVHKADSSTSIIKLLPAINCHGAKQSYWSSFKASTRRVV